MAAEYIKKTHKKNGTTVETTYRIDAAFVPAKIGDICNEFIENYCVANKEIDWLVEVSNTSSFVVERTNKETKEKYFETVTCENYPFVNLRRDFAQKFFPSILKGEPAKAETFKERINRLYGKK